MVAEAVKPCCRPASPSSTAPQAPQAQPPPQPQAERPHAATRALREALTAIEEVGERLATTRPRHASAQEALLDGVDAPQYRRTYVQGCVCKTGIAGGGCCPAHALGAASVSGHAHGLHATMAGLGGALSLLGMASGARVMQLSREAQGKLRAVAQTVQRMADGRALDEAAYARHGALALAAAHARQELGAARGLLAALEASRREQVSNFAIPGALQTLASAAAGAAALTHLGLGGPAAGAAACAAGGLFGLYGAALAVKSFTAMRSAGPPERARLLAAGASVPYCDAVAEHAEARVRQQRRSGWAWSSVAAASALGAAAALGLLAFPGSGLVVTAWAMGSALWAMGESTRTRYAPHVPVSPHADPRALTTPQQRAQVWTALQAQHRAIATAVAQIRALQGRGTRALHTLERHLQPQCGPKSFRVLPAAVQESHARGATDGHDDCASPTVQRRHARGATNGHDGCASPSDHTSPYDAIQLTAAQAWVRAERDLLAARFDVERRDLEARHAELKHGVDPCCKGKQAKAREALRLGQATERLYSRATAALRDDAHALEHAARRLAALDLLETKLKGLREHAGPLSCAAGQSATPQQQDWIDARLLLMQLQGTLGDALPASLIRAQPALFSQRSDALPLENVHVLPHALPELARLLAPQLDAAFLHAFFNPRRTEGELDYVLSREIDAPGDAAAGGEAPACTGKTCCA